MGGLPECETMPKPKGRPKRSTRDDATTKIDRLLLGKAHLIAKEQGIPVAELLSEMVRGPIERAYDKLVLRAEKREGKA
jgi:hypothetical protein